jgi:hypothetical protein
MVNPDQTKKEKTILILSLPLAILVGFISCISLYTPGFYQLESINWQAQSIGQDIMDLFLVNPVLLISAALAYGGSRIAKFIWAGTNLYLVYIFVIYAFDVHFNVLFYGYCLGLGFSFYSMIYFLYSEMFSPEPDQQEITATTRTISVYFIATAILFYILWLSDILTAMLYNTVPGSLSAAGLPTNPVHVLDLAIILPALCGTGILLWRGHKIGFLLAPVMLVFTLLMNFTIGGLNLVMLYHHLALNWIVTGIMFSLAVFNLILLHSYWKSDQHGQSTFHAA